MSKNNMYFHANRLAGQNNQTSTKGGKQVVVKKEVVEELTEAENETNRSVVNWIFGILVALGILYAIFTIIQFG